MRKSKRALVLCMLVAAGSACFTTAAAARDSALAGRARTQVAEARSPSEAAPRDWSAVMVSDDLSYPWDIVRAGRRILITEAAGSIVTFDDGRLTRLGPKVICT
jgi:glucose/arabinose dehydrogenase